IKFLRMRPGHGEQLIAEGDVDVAEDEERLVEEFRRQLDLGMWAAVPLTNEYCVEFPDETRPYGSARLPDSDDVLAKWMALRGDERRLIAEANLHLPGRQVDPKQVRRDLWRLSQWESERMRRTPRSPGEVAAP